MGKTADLTVVQKTVIDTLHKEGKPQKVIAKEAGCSQSAVSKHIHRKLSGRKKCGRKRCTSNRDNRSLERIVSKGHSKMWGSFTRSGLRLESVHQEHHAQTYPGRGLQLSLPRVKPLLNLRRKRDGLLLSGPQSSFQMKVHFTFHLEIKVQCLEEEWRGTQSKLLEVQCEVSTVSEDLGSHVICCCWSSGFSQVQSQRSRLPGRFRALHASFF